MVPLQKAGSDNQATCRLANTQSGKSVWNKQEGVLRLDSDLQWMQEVSRAQANRQQSVQPGTWLQAFPTMATH